MARLPSAKRLDLFDMEVPDGMADMAMPPAQEHTKDPFRYDSGGRNSFHRKRVHRKLAGEARKTKLSEIIEEFPRYGPKMYGWAVDQNDGTWPVQIGIDATKEEWESCIESIQIRKSDEVLAAEDPNKRPLAWDSG